MTFLSMHVRLRRYRSIWLRKGEKKTERAASFFPFRSVGNGMTASGSSRGGRRGGGEKRVLLWVLPPCLPAPLLPSVVLTLPLSLCLSAAVCQFFCPFPLPTTVTMATWKAAGMSYLQYVNACTTALRQIVKVRGSRETRREQTERRRQSAERAPADTTPIDWRLADAWTETLAPRRNGACIGSDAGQCALGQLVASGTVRSIGRVVARCVR